MSNHHANTTDIPMDIDELHHKLGHLNLQTLQEMVAKGIISGIKINTKSTSNLCKSCIQGKAHQQPLPKESQMKYLTYREKIIIDLWGPAQVTSLGGHTYCQFYHDTATGEDHVNFLKAKSKALERYQQYEKWAKMQQNADIKCLGSDQGGKYLSTEFSKHLKNIGTI